MITIRIFRKLDMNQENKLYLCLYHCINVHNFQHKKSAFYSFELQKMYFSDIVFCLKSENAHLVHHSKIGAWFYLKIMLLLSMPQKSCTYNFDENEARGTTFLSNNLKWIKQSLGYASNYDICLDTFYLLRRNFINHKNKIM